MIMIIGRLDMLLIGVCQLGLWSVDGFYVCLDNISDWAKLRNDLSEIGINIC